MLFWLFCIDLPFYKMCYSDLGVYSLKKNFMVKFDRVGSPSSRFSSSKCFNSVYEVDWSNESNFWFEGLNRSLGLAMII